MAIGDDSIKTLSKSITTPLHDILLAYEPGLRLAVPVLLCAFLLTLAIAGLLDVRERRIQAIEKGKGDVAVVATIIGQQVRLSVPAGASDAFERVEQSLRSIYSPPIARNAPRILLVNPAGTVTFVYPQSNGFVGQPLSDLVRDIPNLDQKRMQAAEVVSADGSGLFFAAYEIGSGIGRLVVLQDRATFLDYWRADATLAVTLWSSTAFVVLMLGFAFLWQSRLFRETIATDDAVRGRIETALNSGKCGLWDWNIDKGRLFWSSSMFDILGLSPKLKLFSQMEVSSLAHPGDLDFEQWAVDLRGVGAAVVEREFRMRHERRGWIWLRGRFELVTDPSDQDLHLIGIAVEIEGEPTPSANTSAGRQDVNKLAKTLPREEMISDRSSVSVAEGAVMSQRYPSTLLRTFVLGLCSAGFGGAATAIGIMIGNFSLQFIGSGLLAIGSILVTLSVLRGEGINAQQRQ